MSEIKERLIMVKAGDNHVIGEEDSIDEKVLSHRGFVMAGRLACNIAGAVGRRAMEFNRIGRQVWTGQMMRVQGGKILR